MRKKSISSEDKGGKWLSTFNDMVTLLLTFFVLILSMSSMDQGKIKEASHSAKRAFGILPPGQKTGIRAFDPFVIPMGRKIMTCEDRKEKLVNRVNKIAGMDAKETEKGISVVMGEKVLFKTGMAEITTKDNSALRALSSILRETDCSIRVEGHTDDIPINNHRFSSNWELSSARAVAVVKYLIYKKGISPERLSAAGYGESRPLVPNVSESNRTLNRRVQIVLTLVNTQVDRL